MDTLKIKETRASETTMFEERSIFSKISQRQSLKTPSRIPLTRLKEKEYFYCSRFRPFLRKDSIYILATKERKFEEKAASQILFHLRATLYKRFACCV